MAVALTACSHGHADLRKPSTQDDFGVQMARMNLWREARFRFQRAVELNPNDAMAHNNLAVAFEANGEYEKAAKEYREALRLDRTNQYIQKNYSRYTEFMARNRKRQQRQEGKSANGETKPAAATATSAAGTAATSTAPAAASSTATSTAPAATTSNPPAQSPPAQTAPPQTPPAATTPPAQNPPAQAAPAQNPPPSTPPAVPPSNPPGGSR